jgi:hypothetical protein
MCRRTSTLKALCYCDALTALQLAIGCLIISASMSTSFAACIEIIRAKVWFDLRAWSHYAHEQPQHTSAFAAVRLATRMQVQAPRSLSPDSV